MPYGNALPLTGGAGTLFLGHFLGLDDIIAAAITAVLFGIATYRYGSRIGRARDWLGDGAAKPEVAMVVYYRRSSGDWKYWQTGPSVEPSATWKLTNFVTAPLPKGATAISFGLEVSGKGTLITDDYSMAAQ
jgi:hypothetical protein